MAFFDNMMGLMPGETSGMPNQMGGYGGLLNGDNQLMNIGLGILANNNSKNFGQVIGRGALQGIQQTQQAQKLQQQRKMQEYQMKDYERKQQEYDRQQKALDAFKTKFPEYGEAVELDPKLAIKAAYPNLASNSADPYYTPISTDSGLGSFNNRDGKFTLVQGPNGAPVIKAVDSPELQGKIAGAKAGEAAGYKINTDIPGQVLTDRQVAIMSDPSVTNQPSPQLPLPVNGRIPAQKMPTNNFNTPYPVTFGAPGTTATDAREGTMTDASVAVRNPARPNLQQNYVPPVNGGISVRTPEQQAMLTEQAKAAVDVQKQSDLNNQKQTQGAVKSQSTMDAMMRYLYPNGKPTRDESGRLTAPKDIPLLGNSLTDRALMTGHEYGIHNDKASNIIGVRRLINSLVLDANNGSLGAGVSNSDVEFLKGIQGVVNTAQDPKDIYNAIADKEDTLNRILGAASNKSIIPKGEQVPAKVRRYNPKTGKIE